MTTTARRAFLVLVAAAAVTAPAIALAPTAFASQLESDCTSTEMFDPTIDGGTCVAVQLPDEHEGAQFDCPDGQIGTVTGGAWICPAPVQATPSPVPAPVAAPAPQASPATQAPAPVARVDAQPTRPAPAAVTADPGAAPAELDGEQVPAAVSPTSWSQLIQAIIDMLTRVIA